MGALTFKQQAFVQEFILDMSAAAAARRAGYSERTARAVGHNLLVKPKIQAAIEQARAMVAKRNDLTVDRVVEEYKKLAFANVPDGVKVVNGWVYLTDTDQLTPDLQAAISEIQQTKDGVRIKFYSKQAALDSLAKYMGMFTENLNLKVTEGHAAAGVRHQL